MNSTNSQMILPHLYGEESVVPLEEGEARPSLRYADLVAKTARVTLKDTMRVILALDAVAAYLDGDVLDIIAGVRFDPIRPSPEQVAACERAYYDMGGPEVPLSDMRLAARMIQIRLRLSKIRELV